MENKEKIFSELTKAHLPMRKFASLFEDRKFMSLKFSVSVVTESISSKKKFPS
jgi:hypothetical protein